MAAVPQAPSATPQLGRFELRRVLGKGAQATVWLGFDPRLEREVAVKLMKPAAGADVDHWLHEARSVSRITHPNIVPVFEADMHGQQPYLVFEYVAGRTLTDHLKARTMLPPREAAQLMIGVLEGLQAAHAAGVVHRDLKPSNILVDGSGRPRVMDFGIAVRTKDASSKEGVVGTPGYMSPEAAHGLAPTPSMDVFSAGLVLAELLCGKPVVNERDAYRAIYRVAHEDLKLPAGMPSEADEALRSIVSRAMARDPSQRHASAAKFREALQDWLAPAAGKGGDAANAGSANNSGTLDFLLRRMRHKSDFPAMSDSVVRIQRVATSDKESLGSLANEILKDVALTNKLLRMVNTAHFTHAGGGSIMTVSRAVALVGFAGIRNMALSLVLLEHMHDKSHANQLKEEFLRSLMAGSVAGELCPVARESEEAFIGAMFQNLGRLLTQYYFPEEARQVRSILEDHAKAGRQFSWPMEESASISVLGLSYEDLGLGIAKTWGLPETLQKCMRSPVADVPTKLADKAGERLRWLSQAANEITDTLLRYEPGEAAAQLAVVGERYSKVLGVSPKLIETAAGEARNKLSQMATAMNIHVAPGSAASRLLRAPVAEEAPRAEEHDSLRPHALQATIPSPITLAPVPVQAGKPAVNAAEVMAAGIQDITNSMVDSFRLNEVLKMILETMYRALGFRHVVFCLRDPKTEMLIGRFGLGDKVETVAPSFKVSLKTPSDLFAAVCLKGADTLISDATLPNISARLPAWYQQSVNAPAFLLLPMMLKGAPFALIYADKATAGAIELGEKELSLLRTLRNQAVMAFRQAG